jgi:hypothetical protein
MCDNCSDPKALEALLAEEAEEAAEDEPGEEGWAEQEAGPTPLTLEQAAATFDPQRPIWVSAGASSGSNGIDGDVLPAVMPDLLLGDALAQLARVFFDRDTPLSLVARWDLTIAPAFLDVAARFGGGAGPLMWIFMTDAELQDNKGPISFCDWRRGQLVTFPQNTKSVRDSTRQAIAGRLLRAVILLGGDKDLGEDAAAAPPSARLFAVGSTGSIAQGLLSQGPTFMGGDPQLGPALNEPGSYLLLMREIIARIP